jgi:hypothetical protein
MPDIAARSSGKIAGTEREGSEPLLKSRPWGCAHSLAPAVMMVG